MKSSRLQAFSAELNNFSFEKMYPSTTVIDIEKDQIRGCSSSPTMIGRRGNYEEMFLECEGENGASYKTRVVMDHFTGEIYDPDIHIPYEAMRAFWNEFARTELRSEIGNRDGTPQPLKLIGRSSSGMLYICDVAKNRDGVLYGLHRAPIAKY